MQNAPKHQCTKATVADLYDGTAVLHRSVGRGRRPVVDLYDGTAVPS